MLEVRNEEFKELEERKKSTAILTEDGINRQRLSRLAVVDIGVARGLRL